MFIWIQDIHHKIKPEEVELVRHDYTANEGWETFLSYEDTRQVLQGASLSIGVWVCHCVYS